MTENISTKGYDDNATLKAMAAGLINRRFSSVDEAARTLIGEPSGSNVDRLRRKYREQNWHQKGLDEYVEAEIARRGIDRVEGVQPEMKVFATEPHRLGLREVARNRSTLALLCLVVTLCGITVSHYARPAVTYEDPNKVAEKARAADFAVNAYKGMYDLAFGDFGDAVKRNQRYFYDLASYTEYVDDITNTGLLAGINPGLKVYRNELVSAAKVRESIGEFAVDFTIKRYTFRSMKTVEDCYRVHSFVIRNSEPGLRSSEFSLIGRFRIDELPTCSSEDLAKAEKLI